MSNVAESRLVRYVALLKLYRQNSFMDGLELADRLDDLKWTIHSQRYH